MNSARSSVRDKSHRIDFAYNPILKVKRGNVQRRALIAAANRGERIIVSQPRSRFSRYTARSGIRSSMQSSQ